MDRRRKRRLQREDYCESDELSFSDSDKIEESDNIFVPHRQRVTPIVYTSGSESGSVCASDIDEHNDGSVEIRENNETEWLEDTALIREFDFNESECGIKINVDMHSSPRAIFDEIFSQNVIHKIVDATNKYGKNLFEGKKSTTRKSQKIKFVETNEEEWMKFFGLCLLQAQNSAPSICNLFSNNVLYFSPIFQNTMSGRRFQQLLRCMNAHYGNKEVDSTEKLHKILPVLNPILQSFQKAYSPEKDISLDKSLLLFRGRLSFRQYMKEKKSKYGIKFYELTTSDGYVLNIEIYQGKQDVSIISSKTNDLVLRLMKPYLNRGHNLYMDNFYNSIELSKELLNFKTHSTGTLRLNRKGNSNAITSKKLKKGEHIWRRQGEIYVSKWRDNYEVLSITTKHHPQMIAVTNKNGQRKMKPNDVADYNLHMSGIDRCDQMISYYSSPRKSIRWYKKVIFHILDLCVWNSFYLYRKFHKNAKFLQFRESLIKSLIQLPEHILTGKQLVSSTTTYGRPQKTISSSSSALYITKNQHFIEKIPTSEDSKRNKTYRRCRKCAESKVRKETCYRCKTCPDKPPICPECFASYHLR